MSITITKTAADAYFDTRLSKEIWDGFSEKNLKERALQAAADLLSQMINDDIKDETAVANDRYYPDRAVFEQALYMLIESDHTANGNLTGFKFPGAARETEKKDIKFTSVLSKATMMWLKIPMTIAMRRG